MIKQAKYRGFTLIELMIVVAIIAIMASIALPSYRDSVLKSRRTDAESALLQASQRLEVYYARNTTYTDDVANAGISTTSPEGYYTIAITAAVSACALINCYQITAVPTSKSGQNSDKVKGFRLNSRGERQLTFNGSKWKDDWSGH